jgi:hypothetical protein
VLHTNNKGVVIIERSPHTARFRAGRIVGQPARTGRDSNSIIAVMNRAQQNSGSLCIDIPGCRMLRIVVMKFIAPNIELIPARCRLKIAKSTEAPE